MGNGHSHSAKPHIKMLVLGKTGSGKTTLINMIINQVAQVKANEERIMAITQSFSINLPKMEKLKFKLEVNIEEFRDR